MAWTYGADPENHNRDAVRLNIGDTDTNDQQLQDSEVDYFLSLFGTSGAGRVIPASIRCCEALAAKYARQTDTTNQGLSVAASKRQQHYLNLASTLREQETTLAEVFLGGSTFTDAEKLDDNNNLIQPSFRIGQTDWVRRDKDDPDYWGN
jgi:hypothetical protein